MFLLYNHKTFIFFFQFFKNFISSNEFLPRGYFFCFFLKTLLSLNAVPLFFYSCLIHQYHSSVLNIVIFSKLYKLHSQMTSGWSGGAMVLSKLPVPGRPTNLDESRARAYGACRGCGLFGHFYSHLSFLSSFSLSLGDGPI